MLSGRGAIGIAGHAFGQDVDLERRLDDVGAADVDAESSN